MKTIQLEFPSDIAIELESLSNDMNSFILDAVAEKLEEVRNKNLEALLEEGYKATRAEDLHLTKEFEPADFEHWK